MSANGLAPTDIGPVRAKARPEEKRARLRSARSIPCRGWSVNGKTVLVPGSAGARR